MFNNSKEIDYQITKLYDKIVLEFRIIKLEEITVSIRNSIEIYLPTFDNNKIIEFKKNANSILLLIDLLDLEIKKSLILSLRLIRDY